MLINKITPYNVILLNKYNRCRDKVLLFIKISKTLYGNNSYKSMKHINVLEICRIFD
jgi:hypothetical protein